MLRSSSKTFLLGFLSAVFFLSGVSSLIYQVVWQRLLTLYYGVGPISIALIVGIYMFGLGVGAWGGGVLAERVKNKIHLYFWVELLIGCFGIGSLSFLMWLGKSTADSNYVFMLIWMFVFLSFPTFLMGMTLPLLTKIFNLRLKNILDTVGFLYFINTLGAALGCLIGSYWLISFYGFDTAVYCAAGINGMLAIAVLLTAYGNQVKGDENRDLSSKKGSMESLGWWAYLFAMIMGFTALAYEIIWFRIIGVLAKASAYSFSSVLCVYLLGIALGSLWIKWYLHKYPDLNRKHVLFWLQFGVGVSVAVLILGYYYLTRYTDFGALTKMSFHMPVHPPLHLFSFMVKDIDSIKDFFIFVYYFTDVFLWSLFFMLVPTFFMGASFPLVASLGVCADEKREARAVGNIYFFNVAGSILGAFSAGFFLLPILGSERTLLVLISLNLVWGLLLPPRASSRWAGGVAVGMLWIFTLCLFPAKGEIYQVMHSSPGREYIVHIEEGRDGVVMTYQHGERIINYINGMEHGGRPEGYFYFIPLEAMNFAAKVEDVLIIGYGTGSLVEAVLKSQEVQKVTLVELNEGLMQNLQKIPLFQGLLSDPRIDLVIEDGRRVLLQSDKKYDLVLMDPLKTKTSYSNNLYSQEFFELIEAQMHPHGVVAIWMDEFPVMLKTISSVFEHVRVYGNQNRGFCLASGKPLVGQGRISKLFGEFSKEQQQLIWGAREIALGDERFAKRVSREASMNRDLKPINEYYLGKIGMRKK
jgi:predicted membrane-bound spermidine synthase